MKRLKFLVRSVQTGTTPPSGQIEYYLPEEIDWFTPVDFGNSIVLRNSKRKLSKQALRDNVAKLFPSNSVLLVGIGATLGKVGIIDHPASSNQQINTIIFKHVIIPTLPLFIFGQFKTLL